ncbi:hypothetical protein M0R45_021088 [Rubus argutus]|uniref:Glycoside hydrolase family 3 C-terminal domain-containing protein n=1 Tax=Rubus argutus TaxID=59490 RepID=A0AAW1XC02_RUBAR
MESLPCADPDLLLNTIRGQWKLNGYIVSDCDSVGVFYDEQHYTKTPEEASGGRNLKRLALEAARQGIVLLQNNGHSLPLSTVRHRTIAVIGPNSDVTVTMIGNYAGVACGYTTPLQGIGRIRDRTGLLLPGHQQELVSRVARASRGPTILVLMSGGPIDVSFAKNDPKIGAIFWVGYPGQAGGTAIADVLFGTTNPGGKLPMTWYPQDYVSKLPMTNMAMRAGRGYPGRTYRFYKGPVVFPFGHGLSYTTFAHTLVQAPTSVSVPLTSLSATTNSTILSGAVRVSTTDCHSLLTWC